MTRVAIVGGAGRMGQVMAAGLASDDIAVAVLVDVTTPTSLFGASYYASLADVDPDLVDVVVDFSVPASVEASARWCAEHVRGLVVGTTGLSSEQRAAVVSAGERTGVVMAANFSLGAVLAERFGAMAAPYFDRVEIIELHHDQKVDAPSGTALAAAEGIRVARIAAGRTSPPEPTQRETLEGARGGDAGDGIRVHAVRLPGLVAHQEILLGGPGEGLTIRHDSYDRKSFVPGVALAIRAVRDLRGFHWGIDQFVV